jgi:hypothetical protein
VAGHPNSTSNRRETFWMPSAGFNCLQGRPARRIDGRHQVAGMSCDFKPPVACDGCGRIIDRNGESDSQHSTRKKNRDEFPPMVAVSGVIKRERTSWPHCNQNIPCSIASKVHWPEHGLYLSRCPGGRLLFLGWYRHWNAVMDTAICCCTATSQRLGFLG